MNNKIILTVVLGFSISQSIFAEPLSAYGGVDNTHPQTKLFWGDTHVHTNLSGDSAMFGNRLVGPEEAYRFAQGEAVMSNLGKAAQLETPLDFLLVSDHAETMAAMWQLRNPTETQRAVDKLQNAFAMVEGGLAAIPKGVSQIETVNVELSNAATELLYGPNSEPHSASKAWQSAIKIADQFNKPHEFTTLIGYEWSSTNQGDNLHRVVMYRDGAERAGQTNPVSVIAGLTDPSAFQPEALWAGLQQYEQQTGGQILAIPHNSNLSSGLMFDVETATGPMTADYAAMRKRWEPVVEITQIKGDSEAHPFLSPDDQFADFNNWDKGNIFNSRLYSNDMLAGSYVREGLKRGLAFNDKLGVNPYQFGVIGSTDSHTGLATADSNNFWGKSPVVGPTPERLDADWSTAGKGGALVTVKNSESAASGYAAVWAKENTREAIFDAFKRREVYASTGPRIAVRFFGGFDYTDSDLYNPNFAAAAYRGGVPMGGELSHSDQAPVFLVTALKDPKGANLDRIQIIKGWLDNKGKTQERIFDVAVSDNRKIKNNGRVNKAVGDTVDIKTATYKNSIGEVSLAARWIDPDFNANQQAFYYARVLEIPTPRWTTYDAVNFELDLAEEVPTTTQERAYTSAIWYKAK